MQDKSIQTVEQKEVKCPNCKDGTLELLTDKELKRLQEREGKEFIPDRIMGCDECKFWCDAKNIENGEY